MSTTTSIADDPQVSDDSFSAQPTSPQAAAERGIDRIDLTLGAIRAGVGAAMVVAPRVAGRIWVGPGSDGPGSLVFARALGARDVALGLRIIDAVRKGQPARGWVQAGMAADAADLAATLVASRHLGRARGVLMPMIAGAVGAAGAWSARRVLEDVEVAAPSS